MGGNAPTAKLDNAVVEAVMPVHLSGGIDLTTSGIVENFTAGPFGSRMEVKRAVVKTTTAPNASTTIQIGVVGDLDEFLASGLAVSATGEVDFVGTGLTDQYLEVGEVFQLHCDGTATTGGQSYAQVLLTPVRPA